ncbi:1,4-alpha-glucan branching enzyme GlgB [Arthrobacter sp. Hiyo8]|nr:1,4-alpha-glucan branching enzyme GlgB [Arthrobacter sp. Hiyo8]
MVTEAGSTPMTHETDGIWVAVLEPLQQGHVPDYRLDVVYGDSAPVTINDPYHYLPTVGEVDLHLIGEGRHERLWDTLGSHVQHYRSPLGDVDGVSFAVWAPTHRQSASRVTSTPGMGVSTPCAHSGLQASGRSSSRAL